MMQHQKKDVGSVSEWLGNAQQKKYHDGEVINALATAMTRADIVCDEEGESSHDDDSSSSDSCSSSTSSINNEKNETTDQYLAVITETTLCLHCRGPATTLCTNCGGAYFCAEPRKCSTNGYVFSVLLISFATHIIISCISLLLSGYALLIMFAFHIAGHTNVFVLLGKYMYNDEVSSQSSLTSLDGRYHYSQSNALPQKISTKSS